MVSRKTDRIDLNALARALEAVKQPAAQGVSFPGDELSALAVALQTALKFAERIPDIEQQRIIRQAVFDAGGLGKITSESLMGELAKAERRFLQSVDKDFVLVTTLSILFGAHLSQHSYLEGRVVYGSSLPARYDRTGLDKIAGWPADPHPPNYSSVRVRVSARTIYEAFERGMHLLDFMRGLWNLRLVRPRQLFRFSTLPKPVNVIHTGPCHTVHLPDGSLAGKIFWYPAPYQWVPPSDVSAIWGKIRLDVQKTLVQIRHLGYAADLRDAVVQYARALDGVDFDGSFIKLWAVLELLSGTTGGRYESAIRRTLFLLNSDERHRIILEHLREYRNSTIHHGAAREQAELLTYQLKGYVQVLFGFHLAIGSDFESLQEAGEFLDLPRDEKSLRQRGRLARAALKYRKSLSK